MVQIRAPADDDLRMRRYPQRTRRVAAGVAAGTVLYFLYLLLAPGTASSVTTVNDIAQTVVPMLAAGALVAVGLRSTGRARTSWYLLAGGALCWGIGQAIWTWYEVVLDQEVPYPGPADVGYLGAV